MEREGDSDTNCNWYTRYSHQRIGFETGGLGNKRTSGDYPNSCRLPDSQAGLGLSPAAWDGSFLGERRRGPRYFGSCPACLSYFSVPDSYIKKGLVPHFDMVGCQTNRLSIFVVLFYSVVASFSVPFWFVTYFRLTPFYLMQFNLLVYCTHLNKKVLFFVFLGVFCLFISLFSPFSIHHPYFSSFFFLLFIY